MTGWEDWQRDYRLGLILILPPEEVSRPVDALRARYDPRSQASCPTHVSVSDPLRREMTPALRHEIGEILRPSKPFRLHFDRLQASTEHRGLFWPITPQAPIDALREALHASQVFEGAVFRRRHIPAHMTIAEFISIEEGLRLRDELRDSVPRGSFLCDRLEFIVPDEGFVFRRVHTFRLGTDDRPRRAVKR